ncbi:MAG: hypothetical protein F4Z55_19110 [Boseongicola sp. SB0667_bin_21]|nr:hypothetical protein [Boseongicola sp. SB0667_bin_21]
MRRSDWLIVYGSVGTGLVGGGWIGSSMGIALLGTAIAGTVPVALVGATVCGLGAYAYRSNSRLRELERKNPRISN